MVAGGAAVRCAAACGVSAIEGERPPPRRPPALCEISEGTQSWLDLPYIGSPLAGRLATDSRQDTPQNSTTSHTHNHAVTSCTTGSRLQTSHTHLER